MVGIADYEAVGLGSNPSMAVCMQLSQLSILPVVTWMLHLSCIGLRVLSHLGLGAFSLTLTMEIQKALLVYVTLAQKYLVH